MAVIPKNTKINEFKIYNGRVWITSEDIGNGNPSFHFSALKDVFIDNGVEPKVTFFGVNGEVTLFLSDLRDLGFDTTQSLANYVRQEIDQLPNFAKVDDNPKGESVNFNDLRKAMNDGAGEQAV